MPEAGARPAPEALLAEAEREGRGRLKIFLGAAPGVGKTYAMLEAGKRRAKEGVDVVAALVETHGRAETEAMLSSLEILPRRPVSYKGRVLSEMDIDALLARRPQLALIDELAHTNVPESRHDKRWQDVEEVLDAGIDVYTTLNVQHIETHNDTVARITGVRVRETVPDSILENADEIELIDLPPEELLERLREGKVYVPEQANRAMQNFFAKGNLTALREIAMRAAADHVDAQLREHMAANAISGPWPAQERILVCVNEGPSSRDAIRLAKRSADRARAEWIALTVTSTRAEALPDDAKDRIAASLRLAERLGAELASLEAEDDPVHAVLDFARKRNVRRIVLGRPRQMGWGSRLVGDNLSADLIRQGGEFEFALASEPGEKARPPRFVLPRLDLRGDRAGYLLAVAATAAATLFAAGVDRVFPVASLSLIYMTAVIAVAARSGLGPALGAAGLGFLSYNFLFTEPRFTFQVSQRGELLTLGLFIAASIVTGNLAARLRARIIAQRAIVDRTNKLYDFSRRVAAAATFDDVVWAAVSHVAATLECHSLLLVPDAAGVLTVAGGFPPEDRLDVRDMTAANFAWEKGQPAGRGSDTLPTATWYFVPVRTAERRLGVIGVSWEDGRLIVPTSRRLLELLADQVALAMERIRLVEDLEGSRLASETERLRTALLSSVSHDLRTPLVSIIGAAGSLANPPKGLADEGRIALAEMIREEGERLDRYIQNLLDMTRVGHGALKPRLVTTELPDLIGSARQRLAAALRRNAIELDLPPRLPAVRVDPILTEQVLVNILDNAAKFAPPDTPIRITAATDGPRAFVSISDAGPGIPEAERERVFDMFYRVEGGDRHRTGTGLGLSISKSLIEAQGGTIRVEAARPDGTGTRVVIAFPLDSPEGPP